MASRKTNPKLIGAFVVGAIVLAIGGALAFGGGQYFKPKGQFVVFFQGSLSGLDVGAPVTFRGIKVGSVTSIVIRYDVAQQKLLIPIRCELDIDRFQLVNGQRSGNNINELIKRGLRAQLETISLVTGQTSINMDFDPGTPINLTGAEPGIQEIPTLPSDIDILKGNVASVLAKIGKLPLDQLTSQLGQAINSANQLLANANAQVGPLTQSVVGMSDQANAVLAEAQARLQLKPGEPLQSLNDVLGDAQARLQLTPGEPLANLNQALAGVQKLISDVNGDWPTLAKAAQETLGTASRTLDQTDAILRTAQRSIAPDSPLYFELNNTLREIKSAATAIRVFAEYLQRNPNALLTGNH